MTSKVSRNLTSIGLMLTVIIFIGHYLLPQKRVALHPAETSVPQLYGFTDAESGKSSYWLDEQKKEWECNYKISHSYGCGLDIYWNPEFIDGIDFTAYDAVEVVMGYQGPTSRIRLYLRNYNEAYSDVSDVNSTKFMSLSFPVEEVEGPVLASLSEFAVASWWLKERNVRRQWSLPEFDNISNISVDLIEPGLHRVRVDKIVLVGEWIRTDRLLILVLAFWMSVFLLEGTVRFYHLYKKSQYDRHLIQTLEYKQQSLEEENRSLEELADTDPLTGIYNRAGLQTNLTKLFDDNGATDELGIMLLDIDHFKQLNDTYGHDVGDKVLKAFATILTINLREEDIFARWGGEEFIIICRNRSVDSFCSFAEKLRQISAGYTFGADFGLRINISIGLAIAHKGEAFDEAFKRADNALYRAKQGGRNRVEYEQKS